MSQASLLAEPQALTLNNQSTKKNQSTKEEVEKEKQMAKYDKMKVGSAHLKGLEYVSDIHVVGSWYSSCFGFIGKRESRPAMFLLNHVINTL